MYFQIPGIFLKLGFANSPGMPNQLLPDILWSWCHNTGKICTALVSCFAWVLGSKPIFMLLLRALYQLFQQTHLIRLVLKDIIFSLLLYSAFYMENHITSSQRKKIQYQYNNYSQKHLFKVNCHLVSK